MWHLDKGHCRETESTKWLPPRGMRAKEMKHLSPALYSVGISNQNQVPSNSELPGSAMATSGGWPLQARNWGGPGDTHTHTVHTSPRQLEGSQGTQGKLLLPEHVRVAPQHSAVLLQNTYPGATLKTVFNILHVKHTALMITI